MVEYVLLLTTVPVQMVGLVITVLMVSSNSTVPLIAMMLDINECTSGDPCEQICTNTQGSFHCSCGSGYTVDGSRCIG